MKISVNKQGSKARVFMLIAAAIILLSGSYVTLAYCKKFWPFMVTSSSNGRIVDPTLSSGKGDIPDGKYSDKTTNQVPVSPTLVATIDQLSQQDGEVVVKASVNTTDTTGLCSITFTNPNDKPVAKTTNPTPKGDRIICGPIEIPEQSFSYLGSWTMTFRYYTNSNSQVSAEGTIVIR